MGRAFDELVAPFPDTQSRWSVEYDGRRYYDEERSELHTLIVRSMLVSKPQVAPKVFVLAGGPASGKSSLRATLDLPDCTLIDPDLIKAALPEYQRLLDDRDHRAAAATHEESSDIARMALDRAVGLRHNIILDQVGGGPPGDFAAKLVSLANRGYEVSVIYADTTVERALQRSRERAERTGRLVPDAVVHQKHEEVARGFAAINSCTSVAMVQVYACDDGQPRLIAERTGSQSIEVHDRSRLNEFLEKRGQ